MVFFSFGFVIRYFGTDIETYIEIFKNFEYTLIFCVSFGPFLFIGIFEILKGLNIEEIVETSEIPIYTKYFNKMDVVEENEVDNEKNLLR